MEPHSDFGSRPPFPGFRAGASILSSIIVVLTWFVPIAGAFDVTGKPIVATDLLRLRTVGSVDVAADGTRAVYTVESIAETRAARTDGSGRYRPAEYAYRSHLFLLDLTVAGSQPRQLTHGARRDTSPRLAPDGRSVAFVRAPEDSTRRPADEDDDDPRQRPQVWLLPLDGGEARPLTAFEHGASSPVWSPDGAVLAVSSKIPWDDLEGAPQWELERPKRGWNDLGAKRLEGVAPRPDGSRAEIRAWLEANADLENPAVFTRLDFHDELSLRKPYRFAQLFLVDTLAGEPMPHTQARRVTRGFADHQHAAFMPDGRHIVYAARTSEQAHLDRVRESSLWMARVDGDDSDAHRLLFGSEGWAYTSPRPSLDGSVIAFIAQQQDEPNYRQRQIGLIGARNAEGRAEPIWLTEIVDRSVRDFAWVSARGSILFSMATDGTVPLMKMSTGLIEPTVEVGGQVGVTAFDVGNNAIVYAQTSPMNPCIVMVRTPQHGEWMAHDLNSWVHDRQLAFPTPGWIDRPDGTRVQYWVMEPTDRKPGEKYPLCLQIHGGPSAMWGPGEASMWLEFQLLCSWGYGVVYCNPRGSGGYGYQFQRGNHQNWGHGPAGDVLAAVDRALAQEWVDPQRLVITGGSYAGYLTAWIIAHDHRFKAAVAQRGVYDLTTFFGEGNAWRLVPWAFGGHPWESNIRPILQRESPFTHARQIRTPLLITHASNDLRTGVSQSEMLYRALKVLNRPVEYVRYPDAGHDLSRNGDPRQRIDRLNRIIEFFERHIDNPRPAPLISPDPPPADREHSR